MSAFCNLYIRRSLSLSTNVFKGHSKWQNIQHTKTKNDNDKSRIITSMLTKLRKVVRDGGFDMKMNRDLVALQQEFRTYCIPLETFNKALERLKGKKYEVYYFDVIGPSGSMFIIELESLNRIKSRQSLSKYMNKVGGSFMHSTSQTSNFEKRGVIHVDPVKDGVIFSLDKMEEVAIELDCEDVTLVEDGGERYYELLCFPNKVHKVKAGLEERNFKVVSAEQEMRTDQTVSLNEEDSQKVEKFYKYLEEDEEVMQVFDNIEPEKEVANS